MSNSSEILNLAEKNQGVITTEMAVSEGFSRGSLKYLVDMGRLVRVARGVYTLPEAWEDEFVNFQCRYKRGIYSFETALFLCDLTDRTPARFHMTFPGTYNMSAPKSEGLLCHSCREPYYSIGIAEIATPVGHDVKAYSAERTLCDILKPREHVDIQIVSEAFKRYTARSAKNIPLLSEYAKIFGVEQKLRAYLEVLL